MELSLGELEDVMRECLKASGMSLPESEVKELALVLLEESWNCSDIDEDDDAIETDLEEINIDQFRSVLMKHGELLNNLKLGLATWLPSWMNNSANGRGQQHVKSKQTSFKQTLKDLEARLQRQPQTYNFLAFFFGINLVLFVTRAVYFKGFAWLDGTPGNPFYMISRACGKTNN